jgi:hypothetical protein
MAERETYGRDFCLLVNDDLLSDSAQQLVAAEPQLGRRHFNGALVMGDHHRAEIDIDIACRPSRHANHHRPHRSMVGGEERSFL